MRPLSGHSTPGWLRLASHAAAALPSGWLERAALLAVSVPSGFGLRQREAGHQAAVDRLLGSAGDARDALRATRAHARFVAEFLAQLGGRNLPVEGGADLVPAVEGQGRLLVLTHEGNWIAGGRHLARQIGPIHSAAGVQLEGRWQRTIDERLREHGIWIHHAPSAGRGLARALRAGGTVAIHLDGDQGRGSNRRPPGVRAAALLAARLTPAVHHVRCERTAPGRFRLAAQALLAPAPATAALWEERLWALLRDSVARAPERWMIFR